MSCPLFFVVARVVGSDGSLEKWKERLIALCAVSATEPLGNSYYWGHDLSASSPDTLWGLEGYTHPMGFFLGHTSTDVFKREMRLADEQKLLKTVQGIGSPDYDLHHYDLAGGWLKRDDDPGRDSRDSAVAVVHFWAAEEGSREDVVKGLEGFAKAQREREFGDVVATVREFFANDTSREHWFLDGGGIASLLASSLSYDAGIYVANG
ncbi:hypothetical protein CaCOL14_010015 [Colletotrichum acutatum]